MTKDDLEFLTPLSPPPKCWDDSLAPWFTWCRGTEPRQLRVLANALPAEPHPHLTSGFLTWVLGIGLRSLSLQSEALYPLSHLPGPGLELLSNPRSCLTTQVDLQGGLQCSLLWLGFPED